jgi:hypothetical protein
MTAVIEVLSCSKPAHARNLEFVFTCSLTYLISYAVTLLSGPLQIGCRVKESVKSFSIKGLTM